MKVKSVILLIVIILLGGAGYLSYRIYHYIHYEPLQIDNTGYVVMIPYGMTLQKITDRLASDGVIVYPEMFMLWVRASGARTQLKAGEYFIKPGTSPQAFIEMMIAGRVMMHSITIVEGWNFEHLMQALKQAPKLKQTLANLSQQEIMQKLDMQNEHPEGQFYPDTYHFPAETTDVAFLKRANQLLKDKLAKAWESRDAKLPLKTPYEVLILASIIEKESSHVEEYEDIAGVYIRRLERNMPLQADPTVAYGAGLYNAGSKQQVETSDKHKTATSDRPQINTKLNNEILKRNTPYNTYLHTGLPPTPIAMPSDRALQAATHPKPGKSLYFVARGEGKGHVFSNTLEEHAKAVQQYRKAQTQIQTNTETQIETQINNNTSKKQ